MAIDPTIQVTLNVAVEKIIAEALRYDAGTSAKLSKLSNKWVKVEVQPIAYVVFIELSERPRIANDCGDEPDLVVKGSPGAFLSYLTGKSHSAIEISGDVALAQQLAAIAKDLEIDWEAKLAEYLGDVPAHAVGRRLRGLSSWLKHVGNSFLADAEEYAHYEAAIFPNKDEAQYWKDSVDSLRMQCDRLDARLARIEQASGRSISSDPVEQDPESKESIS